MLEYATVALGYRYRSAAIRGEPDDMSPAMLPSQLRGQPDTRAPHVWLDRGGQQISTLDLFGKEFVLLTGADGGAWIDAARGLDDVLTTYQIGGDRRFTDSDGAFATDYALAPDGAAIIRPDGFVAWRSAAEEKPSSDRLWDVLRQALGWG